MDGSFETTMAMRASIKEVLAADKNFDPKTGAKVYWQQFEQVAATVARVNPHAESKEFVLQRLHEMADNLLTNDDDGRVGSSAYLGARLYIFREPDGTTLLATVEEHLTDDHLNQAGDTQK